VPPPGGGTVGLLRAAVEWIELGRIGAPFGIKGWLHIESHTDPPQGLLGYREWTLRLVNGERLAEREYYRADLVGLRVRNLEGAELGTVSYFVEAPAGAVMVTQEPGGREHWVLAAPPHLRRVDLATGEILVDWPAELK